jgi:hypothetical protein
MQITRTSMLTGAKHTIDIPVTFAQLALWENGALIQDVMPELTAAEREFIGTGVTPEEWASLGWDDDGEEG